LFQRNRLRCTLRDQEVNLFGGIKIVDGRDVGVVELGQRESFLAKSLAGSVVGQSAGGQDFYGNLAFQLLIMALENTTPIPPAPIFFSMR